MNSRTILFEFKNVLVASILGFREFCKKKKSIQIADMSAFALTMIRNIRI